MNPELLCRQWLMDCTPLKGIPVLLDVPSDRPTRIITIERTGGDDSYFTTRATLAVQCWAESRWAASRLAQTVKNRLLNIWMSPTGLASAVEIQSTYNNPDPDSGSARYQIVCSLTMKNEYDPTI